MRFLPRQRQEKQDYTTNEAGSEVYFTEWRCFAAAILSLPPTEAYQDNYKVNGVPLTLSEEYLFNSPHVQQKNDADELFVYKNGVLEKLSVGMIRLLGLRMPEKKQVTAFSQPGKG